jgi:hypothetical protein
MIEIFSNEFWIAILFFISFFLIFFVLLLMKKINNLNLTALDQNFHSENFQDSEQGDGQEDAKKVSGSALEIIGMLEPLVKESRQAAISFDKQVKEKKRLLKELTNALDTRLISINILLSRADALQKEIEERQTLVNNTRPLSDPSTLKSSTNEVVDQQNEIIEMYNQNFDSDSIAQRLSIPKGEVQLVIDLKKKLVAMEENSR